MSQDVWVSADGGAVAVRAMPESVLDRMSSCLGRTSGPVTRPYAAHFGRGTRRPLHMRPLELFPRSAGTLQGYGSVEFSQAARGWAYVRALRFGRSGDRAKRHGSANRRCFPGADRGAVRRRWFSGTLPSGRWALAGYLGPEITRPSPLDLGSGPPALMITADQAH